MTLLLRARLTLLVLLLLLARPWPASGQEPMALAFDPTDLGRGRSTLEIDDRPLTVTWRAHDQRAASFRVESIGPQGRRTPWAVPAARTFRGEIRDDAGRSVGRAAASAVIDGVRAYLELDDGEVWTLEPRAGSHVLRRAAELATPEAACGSVDPIGSEPGDPTAPSRRVDENGCLLATELAFEIDYDLFLQRGGSVDASLADLEALVNAVDLIYAREVGVTFRVGTVVVQTTPAENRYAGQADRLDAFARYWFSEQPDVPRDLAHLLTGTSPGNFIGVAYFNGVCNLGFGYGLSWTSYTGAFALQVGLVAHELGHNFSARHCDDDVDCAVMCSVIGGCTNDVETFGVRSRVGIADFVASAPCLEPGRGTLTPVDPLALPDHAATLVDEAIVIDVLANDRDLACAGLALDDWTVTTANGGSVVLAPGAGPLGRDVLVYTPPAGFVGDDAFDYTIVDGSAATATANVVVEVLALRPADPPADRVPGLVGAYFDYVPIELDSVVDLSSLAPYATEVLDRIDQPASASALFGSGRRDQVGIVFEGRVVVPTEATYTFSTESDDGSRLSVNGTLVVENDGTHGMQERTGSIALAAGEHDVRVEYFEAGLDGGLIVRIEGGGLLRQVIAGDLWAAPGVTARYYDPTRTRLSDLDRLTPYLTEVVPDIDFGPSTVGFAGSGRSVSVAARFTGTIEVPTSGLYRFGVLSSDGARVRIGARTVAVNDGVHRRSTASGAAALAAGAHPIEIDYFQRDRVSALQLSVACPDLVEQVVPAAWFSHAALEVANDACVGAIEVAAGRVVFSSDDATTSGGAPALDSCASTGCAAADSLLGDVWFRTTADCSGTLRMTVEADFASAVAVYAGADCTSAEGSVATPLACAGSCVDGAPGSVTTLDVDVVEGTSYLIRVGGIDPAAPTGIGSLTLIDPAACAPIEEDFVAATVVVDGVNDFPSSNLVDDDRGDTESSDVCGGDGQPESPLDLGRVWAANDGDNLYLGLEVDPRCFCEVNLGVAIDVDGPPGGVDDPFARAIDWSGVVFRPDFVVYDVLPDACNPDNYEVVYGRVGDAWQALVEGSNALGIVDGPFTEMVIPLDLLGVAPNDVIRFEVWITQEGSTKGPLDAMVSDGVQLSTAEGTVYDVPASISMTGLFALRLADLSTSIDAPVDDVAPDRGLGHRFLPPSPNPFNPRVAFRFELGRDEEVTLELFDARGRRVVVLAERTPFRVGPHRIEWGGTDEDGKAVASGAYHYRFRAGMLRRSGAVVLLK